MSSEPLSEQHGTRGFSRWETSRFAGSLRRLGTFWVPKDRDGEDGHPVVAGLADREAEEEKSPGLPWIQLEALFGRNVQDLGLETVDAEGDSDSPPAMKWSRGNIRRLIEAFGRRALEDTNEHGINLMHLTLMGRQLKCARLLFNYAAEQRMYVTLRWRNGDILGWSMDIKSRRLAEFVLQKMTDQCTSPEETARCLRDHFERLVKIFPKIMQKYIMDDKFCFEYGRFEVPQSLFADRSGASIAVLDAAPSSWRAAEGSNEIKEFWTRRGLSEFVDLDSTSEAKVSAASKFLCIYVPRTEFQQNFIKFLHSTSYPVKMFTTQSTKELIQWIWIKGGNHVALTATYFSLFSAILFFAAAAVFGIEEDSTDTAALRFCRSLFFVAAVTVSPYPLVIAGKHRLLTIFIGLYLFIHSCVIDHHTDLSFFLTSFQCILYLLTLIGDLRPFAFTGPIISMIGYVLLDIRPFIILGILLITAFGMAFRVLFANSLDEDDGQGFLSPWRSFESMFYATLGQFEPEVFYTPSTNFLTVWRSFLFYAFLFFASIVLLSLLIAVLGDTCDRVMLTREAELFKSRAWWASKTRFLWWSPISGCLNELGNRGIGLQEMWDREIGWRKFLLPSFVIIPLYPILLFCIGLGVGFASGRAWEVAIVGAILTVMQMVSFSVGVLLRKGLHIPCYKHVKFHDCLFDKLNSCQPESGLLILWFLVVVTPAASTIDSVWQGRLVAVEKMVSLRLKETEEKLKSGFKKLEAALQQQRQETQDRFAKIEGFLEQITQSTPQSSEK